MKCQFIFFSRDSMQCLARLSRLWGVCPSVRSSGTRCRCIKTMTLRISKSLCRKNSSFSDKISCSWVRVFLWNNGVKDQRYLQKRRYFAANGFYSVKSITNRYRLAAYRNMLLLLSISMTLNDLEPPNRGVLVILFAIFGCRAHFNSELRRNG